MLTSLSVYNKTLDYVKTFAKFNTTDSAGAVREYVSFFNAPASLHPNIHPIFVHPEHFVANLL